MQDYRQNFLKLKDCLFADACLIGCSFCQADLRSAHLQVHHAIMSRCKKLGD